MSKKNTPEDQKIIIRDRKTAYNLVFGGESRAVDAVRKDLDKFCRANTSEFHPDDRVHALLSGRREVILRIKDYLTLTVDELYDKYALGKKETDV